MKLVTGIFLAGFLGTIFAEASLCESSFPTSFDNKALKKFTGKNVTARGNWTTRTKMERAILGPDGGVIYIHSNYSTNTNANASTSTNTNTNASTSTNTNTSTSTSTNKNTSTSTNTNTNTSTSTNTNTNTNTSTNTNTNTNTNTKTKTNTNTKTKTKANTTTSKQNEHPGSAGGSPASSQLEELPEQQKKNFDSFSENQPVVVSGVLQHYVPPKLSQKNLTEQVASIPDHYYFDQSKVTVKSAE